MIFSTVDIVIVNWNGGDFLLRCLKSISSADFDGVAVDRTVVVDNCSTDQSMCPALAKWPHIQSVLNEKNLGFGKAANIGARGSTADLLLFLNPDLILESDTLSRAVKAMNEAQSEQVGILGIQLYGPQSDPSPTCARFPDTGILIREASGLGRLLKGSKRLIRTDWDHRRTEIVDHVIGAFYLIRREVFEALGGFDEQFFLYYEDLDLSLRAAQSGWLSLYRHDIRAFHHGGGCSNRAFLRRYLNLAISQICYARKHCGWSSALLVGLINATVGFPVRLLGLLSLSALGALRNRATGAGV